MQGGLVRNPEREKKKKKKPRESLRGEQNLDGGIIGPGMGPIPLM